MSYELLSAMPYGLSPIAYPIFLTYQKVKSSLILHLGGLFHL
jgi:hypothetical protein